MSKQMLTPTRTVPPSRSVDIHHHVGGARGVLALDEVDEVGRERLPERAVGHVLAERHRMLLVVEVDGALARHATASTCCSVLPSRSVTVPAMSGASSSLATTSNTSAVYRSVSGSWRSALRPEHDVDLLAEERHGRIQLGLQQLARGSRPGSSPPCRCPAPRRPARCPRSGTANAGVPSSTASTSALGSAADSREPGRHRSSEFDRRGDEQHHDEAHAGDAEPAEQAARPGCRPATSPTRPHEKPPYGQTADHASRAVQSPATTIGSSQRRPAGVGQRTRQPAVRER